MIRLYMHNTHRTTTRHLRSSFFHHSTSSATYTLSLHDALPIRATSTARTRPVVAPSLRRTGGTSWTTRRRRSEEHTSELQSHSEIVCRLQLEKNSVSQCTEECLHTTEQHRTWIVVTNYAPYTST